MLSLSRNPSSHPTGFSPASSSGGSHCSDRKFIFASSCPFSCVELSFGFGSIPCLNRKLVLSRFSFLADSCLETSWCFSGTLALVHRFQLFATENVKVLLAPTAPAVVKRTESFNGFVFVAGRAEKGANLQLACSLMLSTGCYRDWMGAVCRSGCSSPTITV